MRPQPKKKPARSNKYRLFIAAQRCCLTDESTSEYESVDPHHQPEIGNSGIATKACDSRMVPVIHRLHVKMETPGNSRPAVWAEYGIDPEQVICEMSQRWIDTGHKVFWSVP
jgi:hypothetical protein